MSVLQRAQRLGGASSSVYGLMMAASRTNYVRVSRVLENTQKMGFSGASGRDYFFDSSDRGDYEGGSQKSRPRIGERIGRPFLDPRAPRRIDAIREDPMHSQWGGMMNLLEHAAYCDGQREEHPEGFFFDNTRPDYDSDCDGDPFSASYLTEDEFEFPEEYNPSPYIPGRIMDQIWFLYSVKNWPIPKLCSKFGISSNRLSAIINLKTTEPAMKASGRYDERLDAQLADLYKGRFGTIRERENWQNEQDVGISWHAMADDILPDDAIPINRQIEKRGGQVLRIGHRLPKKEVPSKEARVHDSAFIFRDISGKQKNNARRANPLIASMWDGSLRAASNSETLYRTWEVRYWTADKIKGDKGFPFPDEEEHKGPATFSLPP